MAVVVDTNLLSTIAKMGLATLREQIQLIKRTNREYEQDISAMTKGSTVNIIVPAPVSAIAVAPGANHPNDTPAVTPTKVPITLDQWYRAPFAMTDKQKAQIDRAIVPMQIAEAVRGLVNKIETDVWDKFYKRIYGWAGTAGTTPFATDVGEFLDAEKVANDQLMPLSRRALIMNTAANANWRGLRRNFDRSFEGLGIEPVWTQHVPTHTKGTAAGATTDNAGYAVGVKTVTLASAGTGTIVEGDVITFANHAQTYVVTSGDADVSNGGTISFLPGLQTALPGSTQAITLKESHAVNVLMHPNAIGFAMAPMQQGAQIPGVGSTEVTVVDNDSGLALRLTYFRQHYQDEWSFDALWGSAVPRPEMAVRIAGEV